MTEIATDELVEQVIEACPQFCTALTKGEVSTFINFTNLIKAEPNQIIADIGAIGEEFYLVLDGKIRLVHDENDTEMEVGQIEAGCLAGEMSFFDRQPRSIRLRAGKKGVYVLAISRAMYKRLCIEHSFIAVNLLEFVVVSLDKLIRNETRDMATMYKQIAGLKY